MAVPLFRHLEIEWDCDSMTWGPLGMLRERLLPHTGSPPFMSTLESLRFRINVRIQDDYALREILEVAVRVLGHTPVLGFYLLGVGSPLERPEVTDLEPLNLVYAAFPQP